MSFYRTQREQYKNKYSLCMAQADVSSYHKDKDRFIASCVQLKLLLETSHTKDAGALTF